MWTDVFITVTIFTIVSAIWWWSWWSQWKGHTMIYLGKLLGVTKEPGTIALAIPFLHDPSGVQQGYYIMPPEHNGAISCDAKQVRTTQELMDWIETFQNIKVRLHHTKGKFLDAAEFLSN